LVLSHREQCSLRAPPSSTASIEIPLEEVSPAFDEHGRHASLFRDWSSSVDDPAVQKQLRDARTSAIDELPPHYRAAIVLRDVEGLSTAEVADALGIPVQTAKTRAYRARLLLRKRLSTFMEIERPSETEVHHQKADVRSIFYLEGTYGCTGTER